MQTRRYRIEWTLLGLMLLVLGALTGYSIHAERGRVEARERDRLQGQAQVIEENLAHQLEGVNNALAGVRSDFPLSGDGSIGPAASRRLEALSNAMPGVRTMILLDARGSVLATNRDELTGGNFGQREYFRVPREHPDPATLYVSAPFKTALGVFSVNVVRALTDTNGKFTGIVAATLDPEYFSVVLRSVLYAPDMRASLAHGDGGEILSLPAGDRVPAMDLAGPGSYLSRHRESGQIATVMTGAVHAAGEERMMAVRTFNRADLRMDKPLIVAVSRDLSAIYAGWRTQTLVDCVWYALFAAAASLGLYFLQRRQRSADRLAAAHRKERRDGAERLELALGGAGLGLWDWDVPSGKVIFDQRWCAMLGWSLDEIEPRVGSWRERVHPDDWTVIHATLDPHLKGETAAYESEHRMRHRDGRWVWILDRGKVMERDAAGAPVRVVGTHMDITGRRRQQSEILAAKTQLQATLDAIPDLMFEVGPDGRFHDYHCPRSDILAAPPEAFLGRTIFDILPPEVADVGMSALREAQEKGWSIGKEYELQLPQGRMWFELSVSRKAVDPGQEARFIVLSRDVTERKHAEQELRRSIAFRELLLEAMPLAVCYKDTSGRYTGCNSAFTGFVGKSRDEVVGRTVFEVWPQAYARTYRDRDLDLLEDPVGVQVYESRVVLADGTARDVIFHKARMADDAGRPTGIIGVMTDITEIKQMEARRDQLEAQLRESQKMEALGTLAGGVAHDFNNIVAAILGNVELARQDVGPEHAALESLEEIHRASRRAKALVQQILAFGRRQALERKRLSLAPVVEESARLLRATLPAGVSLGVECAPDAPPVLGDSTQVQQVLLNLCANAWQAMQGRPGSITVHLTAYDHVHNVLPDARAHGAYGDLLPGRYACLAVRDNGSGMDQETAARIFEPFFTTKPVDQGTGLGLAVVHGIVQEHGASIAVESAPGKGTTFRIYFPAVDATVPASPPAPKTEPEHGRGAPRALPRNALALQGGGRRILYVDDDESIVFLMTRLLERQGYRVSGYTEPREALDAVRAEPDRFDLAVTDYNMPDMSGLDVARELREIRADLPVAIASGYITEELRARAPAAGVRELVYKPNTVDELCVIVARLAHAQPS